MGDGMTHLALEPREADVQQKRAVEPDAQESGEDLSAAPICSRRANSGDVAAGDWQKLVVKTACVTCSEFLTCNLERSNVQAATLNRQHLLYPTRRGRVSLLNSMG